jgi:hypothetical protein
MTRTYKIAAGSMAVLLMAAVTWVMTPRQSHEIVVKSTASVQK